MNKLFLILGGVIASGIFLTSCGKNEEVKESQIVRNCVGTVCSFAIEDDTLNRFTNLLGKTVDSVVKKDMLKGEQDSVEWVLKNGRLAETNELLDRQLMPCLDGECSETSNPTGWVYDSTGPQEVSVSGTIVNPDGSTREINEQELFDLEAGAPLVSFDRTSTDDLQYTFTADDTDTGIPTDATYTWLVDDTEVGTGKQITNTFASADQTYTVKLEVTADGMDKIVVENTITTGSIKADIQLGDVNGKVVPVSVDNTTSGLPAGTAYTWEVAGEPTVTAQGINTTLTMPEFNTDYTINLTATTPVGTAFTDTKTVTTGFGQISLQATSIGGTGTDYKLTAVTTDTGLPAAATFVWKIDGTELTGQTTAVIDDHDFVTLGSHTVSVQAKVDGSLVGSAVTDSINITQAGDPELSSTDGSNPLEQVFTANLDDTGIDVSWTKQWLVNGAVVTGATGDALTYQFDIPDENYDVEFKASKDGETKTDSINVTTNSVVISDGDVTITDVDDNFTLTATLDDPISLGITTDTWILDWSTTDTGATITAPESASTDITFSGAGTYDVTITATSPDGGSVATSTESVTVTESYPTATVAVYHVPTYSDRSATDIANLFTDFMKDETNMATVEGNDTDHTLTFTCKDGAFMTKEASDLSQGGDYESNRGPSEEEANSLFEYDASPDKVNQWYQRRASASHAHNNSSSNISEGYRTGVTCWIPQ